MFTLLYGLFIPIFSIAAGLFILILSFINLTDYHLLAFLATLALAMVYLVLWARYSRKIIYQSKDPFLQFLLCHFLPILILFLTYNTSTAFWFFGPLAWTLDFLLHNTDLSNVLCLILTLMTSYLFGFKDYKWFKMIL